MTFAVIDSRGEWVAQTEHVEVALQRLRGLGMGAIVERDDGVRIAERRDARAGHLPSAHIRVYGSVLPIFWGR